MAKHPSKTSIVWKDSRYRDLEEDVRRFKARAIGGRLKELAMLGLLAERVGFRMEMTDSGPELAGGHTIILNPSADQDVASAAKAPVSSAGLMADEPDDRHFDFSSQFSS